MRMRYTALAATFALLAALAATILLTSAIGPLPASAARQTSQDSPARWPAPPFTPLRTHTLTVTDGAGGSVDPTGTTTHREGSEARLTASWDDATHTFARWGGACSGTATTCVLTIYANKTAMATFTPLARDRCTTPNDASCIRAVYKGAPDDYAQVQDIPDSVLIQPDGDGRYQVERGQQVTVVTAAPLPTGYTRFYLQRTPPERPSPTSYEQLILPVGTTYTFTPSAFEGAANLITFDLAAARPWPLPNPGPDPQLGDVVVTTTFPVVTPLQAAIPTDVTSRSRGTDLPLASGTHRFRFGAEGTDLPSLVIDIPTSEHQIKWLYALLSHAGVAICLSDMSEQSVLCLWEATGEVTTRRVVEPLNGISSVSISDVFDYIAASARVEPAGSDER